MPAKAKISKRQLAAEKGMVTLEFALTIPIFLALALLIIGAVIQSTNTGLINDSAREAARVYALRQQKDEAIAVAEKIAGSDVKVSIQKQGDLAKIEVRKPGKGLFSLINYEFQAKHSVVLEP